MSPTTVDGTLFVYWPGVAASRKDGVSREGGFCRLQQRASKHSPNGSGNKIRCVDSITRSCRQQGVGCSDQSHVRMLESRLNTTDEVAKHGVLNTYGFHIAPSLEVPHRDIPPSDSGTSAVSVFQGVSGSPRRCRRHHITRGMQYHREGDFSCGSMATADVFTLKKNSDGGFGLGYDVHESHCNVEPTTAELTCRKIGPSSRLGLQPPLGVAHAPSNFKIFESRTVDGKTRLHPWQGVA